MNVNDSIFAKMMNALQENKAEETKKNLKALKESKAVKEDISQDSQIKTTNKGTDKEKLNAIKPATGKDGVPQSVVNDKKLDEENPDKDPEIDANINAAVKKDKLEGRKMTRRRRRSRKLNEGLYDGDIEEIMDFYLMPTDEIDPDEELNLPEGDEVYYIETVADDYNIFNDVYNIADEVGIELYDGSFSGIDYVAFSESDGKKLIDYIKKNNLSESKRINEDIEVTDEGNIKVTTGGKLIEISDECAECEDGVCPECGEEPCVCEPEEVEEVEDLEVTEEPETEEEEDEFLDESTFNPFLTKFVRENYSNAKNAVITRVTVNKSRLALECKLNFKSGKSAKFNLGLNGIVREGKVTSLRASDNGFFKAEAMRRPLIFKVSYKNNVIKCEGLEYNFKVKLAEGKMKAIRGKLIRG